MSIDLIAATEHNHILNHHNSNQPTSLAGNNKGWLLLRLEVLFCSIQMQYEYQIFILSLSSSIYTKSIRSKEKL